MYKSKLLQHLRLLDAQELKRLLQFLKSPFYNANPRVVELYRYLRKSAPDYQSPRLAKEEVFKHLFPNRAYDHQKLLNLMSAFTALLRRYLQLIQLEKEPRTEEALLLHSLSERAAGYALFVREAERSLKNLDRLPYRNAAFYRRKFELKRQLFNHPETDRFNLGKIDYTTALEHLDRGFILDKLSFGCEAKAREKPLDEQYDIWLLPEIRAGIADYPADSPMTGAYLAMLDLLESGEEEKYYRLKELFQENLAVFDLLQRRYLLQSLINYAIKRGNAGQHEFVIENLELYQFGLQHGLLLEYNRLNDMTYLGIVNVALRAKEPAWCRTFIATYAEYLPAAVRKDAESLATALRYYAEERPDEAVSLLREVSFLNVYYQIQARVLLLKIFVEEDRRGADYTELILSQAGAFERYLRRNVKIGKARGESLLNFARYVKRITRLWLDPAYAERRAELYEEIEKKDPLYNRGWLLGLLE